MTHLWVRAEQRANEDRVGLMPQDAARLIAAGIELTVEHSGNRCIPIDRYAQAGAAGQLFSGAMDAPACA